MRVLAIVRRDLLRMARNPVRTALMFAMPLALAGIFVLAFGGGDGSQISIRVLVWDEDESLVSWLVGGRLGATAPAEDEEETGSGQRKPVDFEPSHRSPPRPSSYLRPRREPIGHSRR